MYTIKRKVSTEENVLHVSKQRTWSTGEDPILADNTIGKEKLKEPKAPSDVSKSSHLRKLTRLLKHEEVLASYMVENMH